MPARDIARIRADGLAIAAASLRHLRGRVDGPGPRLRGHRPLREARLLERRARCPLQRALRRGIDQQHLALVEARTPRRNVRRNARAAKNTLDGSSRAADPRASRAQRALRAPPRPWRFDEVSTRRALDAEIRAQRSVSANGRAGRPRTAAAATQIDEDETQPLAQPEQHGLRKPDARGIEQAARRDGLAVLADEGRESRTSNSQASRGRGCGR